MGANDEVVNTWGQVRDVTVQWTIIAEGRAPHSKAWLSDVESDRVSIHHCLFANNADRNLKIAGAGRTMWSTTSSTIGASTTR